METKKLSRTVRKRLNKKARLNPSAVTETNLPETAKMSKKRKRNSPVEVPHSPDIVSISKEELIKKKKKKKLPKESLIEDQVARTTVVTPMTKQKKKVAKSEIETEDKIVSISKEELIKKKKKKKLPKNEIIIEDQVPRTTVVTPMTKQKKKVAKSEIETEDKGTLKTINKQNRKRVPENKVIYINSNYGNDDPNGVGNLIQAELVELRKQSQNIKTASDLTESQAHVIKRQITRLHGGKQERAFKRPKHHNKTLQDASKELMEMMDKRKSKYLMKNSTTV